MAAEAEQFVIQSEKTPPKIQVHFRVKKHVDFGQSIGVLGANNILGSWDVSKVVALTWTDGDHWQLTIDLPGNTYLEYKFVVLYQGKVLEWETGPNHRLTLPRISTTPIKVFDSWGGGA